LILTSKICLRFLKILNKFNKDVHTWKNLFLRPKQYTLGMGVLEPKFFGLVVMFSILIFGPLVSSVEAPTGSYSFSFVAKSGDIIDGKTILQIATPALNDVGDVVFSAPFSGGKGNFYSKQFTS